MQVGAAILAAARAKRQGEEQHPAPECDADAQAIVREDWYIAGAVVSVTLVDVCKSYE